MPNTFIWADLSTFDLQEAKRFYQQCFGWKYQDIGEGYLVCEANQKPAAGLYAMPEKFQSIGMPSFWMSYIRVEDINQTVLAAEKHGAKVEVKPQAAPGGGLVALIRDPAGAGFTCYEGEDLGGRDISGSEARMAWNELHVSSLAKVEPFYTSVFGWIITPSNDADRYDVRDPSGEYIASIRVTDNELKGDKEYWGVYFSVENLEAAKKGITRAGGEIVAEQLLEGRVSVLAYDSQGAAFYLLESKPAVGANTDNPQSPVKWRAILGLLIVALAVILEANWVWGILFLLWVIPDIKSGSTHFLEHIERRKNPILYWLILGTWLSLSLYLLAGWAVRA